MTGSRGMLGIVLALLLLAGDAVAGSGYQRAEWPWIQAGCMTTRTRVLIRDAERVELDAAKCKVISGEWRDRYTGSTVYDPRALDVDHMVPLKWAYEHGAARWPREMKVAYANGLGYRFQLLAVSASANRAKGSKGPAGWRPDAAELCMYGHAWATVLIVWDLTPDQATRDAIRELAGRC